ncbi:hypothetical protein [Paenibacillus terrae]|uniref:Uncharacterized protein n=1 Tax=Paenibacillus terrae TaxID=159743 RepID=A0A0D7WWH2_9BACL|nr:hypothetical protein [Paenibacillus terrae]KJD43309.1 hypothetical protein QD47_23410 [Paenibacillus terrae]
MEKQEVKIEYNNNKVFFFKHSFKTALEHANDFIERNKGKFEMKLFILNERNFWRKWKLTKVYKK